jgi:hypothetical protein
MFVKKSWNTKAKKCYEQYQLVESHRHPESGQPRVRCR